MTGAITGPDIFHKKFTGQDDDGTGLMFYKARYYDPAIGRFISADSMIPGADKSQAFNRYMYVLGNPVTLNDPTGHWMDTGYGGGYSGGDIGFGSVSGGGNNTTSHDDTGVDLDNCDLSGTGLEPNGPSHDRHSDNGHNNSGNARQYNIPPWVQGSSSMRLYKYLVSPGRTAEKNAILEAIYEAYYDTMEREKTEPDPFWGANSFPIMIGRKYIYWKDDPFIRSEMDFTEKVIFEKDKQISSPQRNSITSMPSQIINHYGNEKNRLQGLGDGYRFDNIHFNLDLNTDPNNPMPVVHYDRYSADNELGAHGLFEALPSFLWNYTH